MPRLYKKEKRTEKHLRPLFCFWKGLPLPPCAVGAWSPFPSKRGRLTLVPHSFFALPSERKLLNGVKVSLCSITILPPLRGPPPFTQGRLTLVPHSFFCFVIREGTFERQNEKRFVHKNKAPLCKGSWHGEAVTEGLFPCKTNYSTVARAIILRTA